MTVPASSPALPEHCILISYDAEANNSPKDKNFVPGSTISFGAAAFLMPERTLLREAVGSCVLHVPIAPRVAPDENARNFWAQHPEALTWTGGLEAHHTTPEWLFKQLQPYFTRLKSFSWHMQRATGIPRPLALISRPHAYDSQHLLDIAVFCGLDVFPRWTEQGACTWHDVAEVLATRFSHSKAWAKSHFERHLPMPLPHIADQDALLQGFAFIRAYGQDITKR